MQSLNNTGIGRHVHLTKFITVATKTVYEGGRFINEMDIKNNRKVCVIGEKTKNKDSKII